MVVITDYVKECANRMKQRGISTMDISFYLDINKNTLYSFFQKNSVINQLPPVPKIVKRKLTAFHLRQIDDLLMEYPKLSLKDIIDVLELDISKEGLRK